jgi:DNA-binding MarR family transcriptional regulator
MSFDFSQTYLYKLHKLNNSMDRVFDQNLRTRAGLGLSQFTLLLSIDQFQPVGQRQVADFLDLSAGAISRQVDLAQKSGWITVKDHQKDRRGQLLELTHSGKTTIDKGMKVLEEHVFPIFDDSGNSTHLIAHLNLLLGNIANLNSKAFSPKGLIMNNPILKAADLFAQNGGDLNKAVIDVQNAAGSAVTDDWWKQNIGEAKNDLETAQKFDAAYDEYLEGKVDKW